MGIARKAGARIVMVTAEPDATLPRQADQVVCIPAQTMAKAEGTGSGQAMGSAFEQSLWILLDAIVPRLRKELGQSLDDLRARHTNLE
jgi:6-phospho-3-hexuloisomerase